MSWKKLNTTRSYWVEEPKNLDLEVVPVKPDGAVTFMHLAETVHRGSKVWHHCGRCGGWIDGWPREYAAKSHESNSRIGMSYHCARCGVEIEFNGVVLKAKCV